MTSVSTGGTLSRPSTQHKIISAEPAAPVTPAAASVAGKPAATAASPASGAGDLRPGSSKAAAVEPAGRSARQAQRRDQTRCQSRAGRQQNTDGCDPVVSKPAGATPVTTAATPASAARPQAAARHRLRRRLRLHPSRCRRKPSPCHREPGHPGCHLGCQVRQGRDRSKPSAVATSKPSLPVAAPVSKTAASKDRQPAAVSKTRRRPEREQRRQPVLQAVRHPSARRQ